MTEILNGNVTIFINHGNLNLVDYDESWAVKYKNYIILNKKFNSKFVHVNIPNLIYFDGTSNLFHINNVLYKRSIFYIKQNKNSLNNTSLINIDLTKKLTDKFKGQKFYILKDVIQFIKDNIYNINININYFLTNYWVSIFLIKINYSLQNNLIYAIADDYILSNFGIKNLLYKLEVDYDIDLNYSEYKSNIENSYLIFYLLSINYAATINACLSNKLFKFIYKCALGFKSGLGVKNLNGEDEFNFLTVLAKENLNELLAYKDNKDVNFYTINSTFSNFYQLIIFICNELKHFAIFLSKLKNDNELYKIIISLINEEHQLQKQSMHILKQDKYFKLIDFLFFTDNYETVDDLKKFINDINHYISKLNNIISYYQRISNIQYLIHSLDVLAVFGNFQEYKCFQYFCCFRGRIYSQHPRLDWINNKLLRYVFTIQDSNLRDNDKFKRLKHYFIASIEESKLSIYRSKIVII